MKQLILFITICFLSGIIVAQVSEVCEGDHLLEPIYPEIQVTQGVQYGVGTDVLDQDFNLLMDIYEPVGDDLNGRPVVIMAHGGSFVSGTRTNPVMVNTCTELAKRGYVAASIDYTLWPVFTLGFPDSTNLIEVIVAAMGDMKTAVRFFNEDGLTENKYKVNPNLISAGGYSAGAIIACHLGVMDEDDELIDFVQDAVDDRGGFSNLGTRLEYNDDIVSVINFSGSIYNLDYIDEDSAPIYSAHGNNDATVPFVFGLTGGIMSSYGSSSIATRYNLLGLDNAFFTFEGGGHTDIFTSVQFQQPLAEMLEGLYVWNRDQVCKTALSNDDLIIAAAKIYPNPANDLINIRIPAETSSEYMVEMYNQIGQQVFSSQLFNTLDIQVDITGMSNGIYFTKVIFKDTYASITQRIVVAK